MERALVIGASGYLGGRLLERLGARGAGTAMSRPRPGLIPFDATQGRLGDLLDRVGSGVTHVFVPYGAIDPERCARDPAGTMAVNVVSVVRLLKEAMDAGLTPVFFSTDYVFDGVEGGFRETDPALPGTSYGAQKRAVELWLETVHAPWLVARMSKVVGAETGTHSVIGPWVDDIKAGRTMRCAQDQVFSPAWVDDVARALIELAERGARGVYHVAGPEPKSRLALAEMFLAEVKAVDPGVRAEVVPCRLNDLPFTETRPLNTFLDVSKLAGVLDWRFRPMREVCAEAARLHFAP